VVLNRFLGVPIFLGMMYLLFTFAINIGAIFIDFFDILLGAWLVEGSRQILEVLHAPAWLSVILADGLGGGIQLVGTFIPVIGFLYLGLALLESSGYIVRAAFVVDRLMQTIGLPGKAFVPLIVGFGCNVPAIMATRTMNKETDRLVTIAMTPFMSCGARLPVYALFAAALFAEHGQNVVFALYLLGIVAAVFTGWLFRNALFQGELSTSIMEMPVYHLPSLRNIVITTWQRLRGFIERAGKTIVAVVMVLSFLNSWGTDGSFGNEDSQQSMLSKVSISLTPALKPLGVQEDNWPATVGIITGIFAKEAVVGTLDALYTDVADYSGEAEENPSLWAATGDAFASIWTNTLDITGALVDPFGITVASYDSVEAAAEDQDVRSTTLTTMAALFVTPFAAFSYLILILLYTPCVAAMGALVREAGPKWGWVIIGWSTLLAYSSAVIVYQAGTLLAHPVSSISWIAFMVMLVVGFYQFLKQLGRAEQARKLQSIIPTRSV
jgi:ferrous iron transport protein B